MHGSEELLPMLPVTTDAIPIGENWAFEVKWDGIRALCHVTPGQTVKVITRKGLDQTARFPELRQIASEVSTPCILDGEIVVLDAKGKPDFASVLRRTRTVRNGLGAIPNLRYVAFDLLQLETKSLLTETWENRRARLQSLWDDLQPGGLLQFSPAQADGQTLWDVTGEWGLEGLVAKERNGIYRPGERSATWRKMRHLQTICTLCFGLVLFEDRPRSLLLASSENPDLYVGRVGSGVPTELLHTLQQSSHVSTAVLPSWIPVHSLLKTVPRAGKSERYAYVADPFYLDVRFAEWTEGGTLRQPVLVGIRTSLSP